VVAFSFELLELRSLLAEPHAPAAANRPARAEQGFKFIPPLRSDRMNCQLFHYNKSPWLPGELIRQAMLYVEF
jgi:hypothetical protein